MYRLVVVLLAAWLASCSNSGPSRHPVKAAGGRVYGGTLQLSEDDRYVSLYPPLMVDILSVDIGNQIYDGLVRINCKNVTEILPDIAESWEVNAAATVYTFKIRKGVKFHDDSCFPEGKGREVRASDIKYSLERACTAGDNAVFESFFKGKIKGADAFYENSKKGVSGDLEGIRTPDEYTVQITLASPSGSFLYILAGAGGYIFPKEAVEKYGNKSCVGTGPFRVASEEEKRLILVRNNSYFRADSLGNPLPFLDSIVFNVIPDKTEEMDAFKKGQIHLISHLPADYASELVEQSIRDFSSKNPRYILYRVPEIHTDYYLFNTARPPFNDPNVRKAFSYAINRDKIISNVLNAEAYGPGICGITSPGIPNYDITGITGYNFNSEKARKYLAEAGYPNGRNFPRVTIEVNRGGGRHLSIAEEIKKQLKDVLNVEVDFTVVPFIQKLEDAKYGRAEIFRYGWLADYPSPESFLHTFYGGNVPADLSQPSYPNVSRYKNPAFDSLFIKGSAETNPDKANAYYRQAEQILMNDAPLIVLWYNEGMKVIHSFVRNFSVNALNYFDYSEVYLQRDTASPTP